MTLTDLLSEIRECTQCASELSHAPRPVVVVSPEARLLIIGQAPGARVHATGIPWNDPSGDRLRDWLGLESSEFYNAERVAIVPMGFCYPGKGVSGDLPPRSECAPLWHKALMRSMPQIRLRLLVGQYAQRYYLGKQAGGVTDCVRRSLAHEMVAPDVFCLPHPSPRNNRWFKRHPWFEQEVLPRLRQEVARCFDA
ncbi:uracil-DNA glycosylase family protein [Aestuariirhabdus sp. Z084]|uniref:uracil-DNA glycosylase family protein n=1 Tax=Aestuariirhabdus haliotis TaxID=2918751 RepID=UPI00201B43C8|nr:uracil-DNA glycosylase family protein [Aestuariirhabdus haliotis]MCL6415379.1 uracil-DNA glycosylase family protein [Aestuariirhabdus haliotis]MCL6419135.1 uracil-DNA glycosylase family protein [Aestuariirhabdus haliotis]